ncbi:rod shape-determining protein MreD [Bacillus weihaiensis]|uniref:Rod shape-determining protein MreD n=1 Tax=Bacillus weihaiensis TaxID=1547283 RepID=A0A1L3MPJ7_9BACI|nr:rod shape-determining protein MreD [Bacillus weihaiensis]APH04232.1 rod shape-determining protein MreD [Bacillus weihaiensis]
MRRFLLPFLVFFAFISESTFAHLVQFPFATEDHLFVPRFVLIVVIFITVYLNRTQGMLFGFFFGLLHDIVYIEVVGIYLFPYAMIAYLISKAMKVIHGHVLIVLLLIVLAISVLEFYVYGVNLATGVTSMKAYDFTMYRLLPTLALNTLVALLFVFPFRGFLTKLKQAELED